MPPVWLSCLSAWLACFVLFRPFRHYCLSFLFAQLYPHRQLSQWLNIRYESDLTWKTNRRETSIYMPGLAVKAFTWFSGMEVALSADVRKRFVQIQSLYAKDISMERYFGQVVGQTMTMDQFEAFLSDSILLETNRVFRIVDADKEAKLQQDVAVLRTIVNTLVGSPREALTLIVRQFARVRQLSDLLKSVPEHQRLLLFVPQLTLITNFSKMLLKTRGNTEGVEPHFFLEPVSSFFVVETHGQLVFVDRHPDTSNYATNRAFGPNGFLCPGNTFTIKFIASILSFLQALDITVRGEAKWAGGRFPHIANKKDIMLNFRTKVNASPDT